MGCRGIQDFKETLDERPGLDLGPVHGSRLDLEQIEIDEVVVVYAKIVCIYLDLKGVKSSP